MYHSSQVTKVYSAGLHQLLGSDVADDRLLAGVAEMALEYGNGVYKEMLLLLVGKHFGTELSCRYWHEAIEHCRRIFRPEFAGRGFRPALLDYLSNVVGEFNDPRMIEADYLRNITKSSVTDGLTGLYNQTYFKKILGNIFANHRRSGDQRFALILLDLDHFKQYNDRCGHLYGDEALRLCARLIAGALRDGDMAVRYGGEEFALLLPNMDRQAALAVAERIRRDIEAFHFPKQELLESGNLTISGGIAMFPESGNTPEDLIHAADQELYRAKAMRNRIYTNAADRRSSPRRSVRSLVEYASSDGSLYRPAISLNISDSGMGIGCECMLVEGMTLSVRLTRPYWTETLNLTAKIRQVRRENGLHFVGMKFDEKLVSLEKLLANHKHPLATFSR